MPVFIVYPELKSKTLKPVKLGCSFVSITTENQGTDIKETTLMNFQCEKKQKQKSCHSWN